MLAAFPALEGEIEADVCVIGGGYTGLSAALHLRKKGYDVVLLEAERVGWGASGRNGGHVGTGQRADQHSIERWVGLEAAKELWQIGLDAVQKVCDLIHEHQIRLRAGFGQSASGGQAARRRGAAGGNRAPRGHYGYQQLTYLSPEAVAERTSAQGFYGALLDDGCRHLHPLKYALGLARAAAEAGVRIYEGTRGQPASDGRSGEVKTPRGCVRAQARCARL